MSTPMIIMLIVLVVLIGVCVALYFFGKKAQKKQAEQQQHMDSKDNELARQQTITFYQGMYRTISMFMDF